MTRNHFKIIAALIAGVALSQLAGPTVHHVVKYFDLRGYKGLHDTKLAETPKDGIPNFALLDANGEAHELYRQTDAKAVVIIVHGNDCPILQKYGRTIVALKKEYETRDIKFFMLNANPQDTKEEIIKQTRQFPVHIPVLLDPSQVVAKELGVSRTAEAVMIDPKTWKIIYRGAIDDSLTYNGEKDARQNFLRQAMEDFLHDKPVTQMTGGHVTMGCAISFVKPDHQLTYTKDTANIFAARCLFCHSQGYGNKPYLMNYDMVKGWSAMIRETLVTQRMPPWGWDMTINQTYHPGYKNWLLTTDELRNLVTWIDDGAPRGEGPDPLQQYAMAFKNKRRHVRPADLSYSNKEISVPPKGFNEYKFYQIGGPTEEDMWITGTTIKSTNSPTIHHQMMIVTDKPLAYYSGKISGRRDESLVEADETGDIPAWDLHEMRMDNFENLDFIRIQVYGLGLQQPQVFSKAWGNKLGFYVKKGSYIILETHYHGTGKPEVETTTLGLYTAPASTKMASIISGKVSFLNHIELPAGGKDIKIVADPVVVKHRSGLLALGLHMHMRGSSAQYFATYPDGKEELLASHPLFNYNTSTARGIAFPANKILPAGTSIRIECHYDNSTTNPYNPDPTKAVHWGQTIDRSEMCMGYVWYYDLDINKNMQTENSEEL